MHFAITTYADNYEDVLLRRAFPGAEPGFYIDVGAYDPTDHSVTKHFYDAGWRGINIEPNPAPFARLVAERIRDVNLNVGLSDREGLLTLFEAPSACWSVDRAMVTGYFGADPADVVERSIPVTTLARVCERHVPDGVEIDFLKIDVEGHEREVILGGDWARWRPRIVLAEANGAEAWEPTLLASGYLFAFFDGVNRIFVREEDRHLIPSLSVPVNAGDQYLVYGYYRRISELETSLDEERQAHGRTAAELARSAEECRAHRRRIGDLEAALEPYRGIGPTSLRVVRQLKRVSHRHPRASSILRRLVRPTPPR